MTTNLFEQGYYIFLDKTVSIKRAMRFAHFGASRGFDVAVEEVTLDGNPDYAMWTVWYRPRKEKN